MTTLWKNFIESTGCLVHYGLRYRQVGSHQRQVASFLDKGDLLSGANTQTKTGIQFLRQLAEFRHFQGSSGWSLSSVQIQ